MKKVKIGPWTIAVDQEETRKAYENTPPETCQCDDCKNFFEVMKYDGPPEFMNILEKLGIDWKKPGEKWAADPFDDDGMWINYSGGYPFLGEKVDGPESEVQREDGSFRKVMEEVAPAVEICFSTELEEEEEYLSTVPASQVILLEYSIYIPWIMD